MKPKKADSAPPSPVPPPSVLAPDTSLVFPEFVLLKASAGSGKTHALSLRFVQFLLSERVGKLTRNDLPNILAITFTRNAAREMKERILDWLKKCYFQDAERTAEILSIVSTSPSRLPLQAADAIERILGNYTDFQVDTIDSFMAAIFRASAVDLGISQDYETVLEPRELIDYAFFRYLRRVSSDSDEGRDFERILRYLLLNQPGDRSFAWDPVPRVLENMIALIRKLAAREKPLKVEDLDGRRAEVEKKVRRAAAELDRLIDRSPLEKNTRGHCHSKILPAVKEGRFVDLVGCSFKTDPVKKPPGAAGTAEFARIMKAWQALETAVRDYRRLYAQDYFSPYLQAYDSFAGTLDQVKRQQGVVFIDDINKKLAGYMGQGIVPDIYFRLGERVFHFLIDEFQDTSPIQWTNLTPLIENSLAQAGSLFVVGDTKQAIYGFRDADFRIMKGLEDGTERTFESVTPQVRPLDTNYRSHREIVDFVRKKFEIKEGDEPPDKGKKDPREKYFKYLIKSDLNECSQNVDSKKKEPGYVEYVVLERRADPEEEDEEGDGAQDAEAEAETPEKSEVQKRVQDLHARGYAYSDIAILTYKNESVVNIASWLNEKDIPIIPFSSLDIRKRKIITEILAFLQFLDSPPDDLSFGVFLLSEVLKRKMAEDGRGDNQDEWRRFLFECRRAKESPLYSAYRKRYPEPWDLYFERFFKIVGYYPLYDLVTLMYRVFNVFALFPEEEAALAKLLEAIKDFEGQGRNDLREFLSFSGREESEASGWTVDVPSDINAVKIMSIHKAKGLGFPAVILLLYGEKPIPPDFYLGEEEDGVRILKLTAGIAEADEELGRVYQETWDKEWVNKLNTLYVALTRARAELHVIGVKKKRTAYPFDFLGTKPYASSVRRPKSVKKEKKPEPRSAGIQRLSVPFELPPNPHETLNAEGIRRGERIHAVLAEVEYLKSGWEAELADIIRRLDPRAEDAPLYEAIRRNLVRYFQGSELQAYFEPRPGRRVHREFQVCDASGNLFRMDRMVDDPDEVRIIDFKTGADPDPIRRSAWEEGDKEQVRSYIRIVREIYPGKTVSGILAYIDKNKWDIVQ